jgi:hypothetical protein
MKRSNEEAKNSLQSNKDYSVNSHLILEIIHYLKYCDTAIHAISKLKTQKFTLIKGEKKVNYKMTIIID